MNFGGVFIALILTVLLQLNVDSKPLSDKELYEMVETDARKLYKQIENEKIKFAEKHFKDKYFNTPITFTSLQNADIKSFSDFVNLLDKTMPIVRNRTNLRKIAELFETFEKGAYQEIKNRLNISVTASYPLKTFNKDANAQFNIYKQVLNIKSTAKTPNGTKNLIIDHTLIEYLQRWCGQLEGFAV